MPRFAYYTTPEGFRNARGNLLTSVTGLPGWGRLIVGILALPGICLIGLSLLAFVASIATLFLLTVPAYVVLRRVNELFTGEGRNREQAPDGERRSYRPARRIEATVVEVGTPGTAAAGAEARS